MDSEDIFLMKNISAIFMKIPLDVLTKNVETY